MSRSYKKHAINLDKKGKSKKRLANSKVRSWLKDNPDVVLKGKNFRKIYEPQDVCEFSDMCSWEEYWQSEVSFWERYGKDYGKSFPSKKKEYRYWYTTFKRK